MVLRLWAPVLLVTARVQSLLLLSPIRLARTLTRFCLPALVCAASASMPSSVYAQQAGSVDPAFAPGFGVDGGVKALAVQPDGKLLVAGQFDHVDGTTYDNLARLNPDGSLDATFNPVAIDGAYSFVTAYVNTLAVQPDGRILVGGSFSQVGGKAHQNLARLNADGSVDESFMPTINTQGSVYHNVTGVTALAIQVDGKIVVAGGFDLVDAQPRRGIARLNADGSLDASFDPAVPANVYPAQGLDGDVFALALGPTGEVYVAGTFHTINGVSQSALARLRGADGHLDAGFAPPLGSYSDLDAIACQPDGRLLVAGYFDQPGGQTSSSRSDLARFNADGSSDDDFSLQHANGGYDSSSIALIAVQPQDGSILIAGDHLYLDGQLVGAVGRYLSGGKVDKSFYPGLDPLAASGYASKVTALALGSSGAIIVGGDFDTVDDQFRHHLAGLLGVPDTDCPEVNATALIPLAVAGNSSAGAAQNGKFMLSVDQTLTTPLQVHYAVAGKGLSLVENSGFSTGTLVIPAGKRKAKLKVRPYQYVSTGPNGKSVKLSVEAGRGYVVGGSSSASVRVISQ